MFPLRKFNLAFLSQRILTIFSWPQATATWSGVSKLIIVDNKSLILPDISWLPRRMSHVNVLPEVEPDPHLVLIVTPDGVMEASRHLEY